MCVIAIASTWRLATQVWTHGIEWSGTLNLPLSGLSAPADKTSFSSSKESKLDVANEQSAVFQSLHPAATLGSLKGRPCVGTSNGSSSSCSGIRADRRSRLMLREYETLFELQRDAWRWFSLERFIPAITDFHLPLLANCLVQELGGVLSPTGPKKTT